jgi:hypothetical protein
METGTNMELKDSDDKSFVGKPEYLASNESMQLAASS